MFKLKSGGSTSNKIGDKKMTKPRSFWFHYNKPASIKAGYPRLSIHYMGKCHIVNEIECNVYTKTRLRSQQPKCVIAGTGIVHIEDNVAKITKG
jgi:hypothetical protein